MLLSALSNHSKQILLAVNKMRQTKEDEDENKPGSSGRRNLRKRKVNLNRLASSIACPLVCQFQHCGVQLSDGDTLEWHYQGHLTNELERLDHVRVKKNTIEFPDRQRGMRVRNVAFERVARRRSRRQATNPSSTHNENIEDSLACPVCAFDIPSAEYSSHLENCLTTTDPPHVDDEPDEDVDIDTLEAVETYTWAGHTRVRATSLVQGGLRGPGFVSITRSDEDQVLDIEGDGEEEIQDFGESQYTDSDLIVPKPETEAEAEEFQERSNIQEVLTGQKPTTSSEIKNGDTTVPDDATISLEKLMRENEELRQKSMCNICMDSYQTPLVSTVCWHVSCEECWMRALGTKKLCPQCKVIIQPKHLRKIYL